MLSCGMRSPLFKNWIMSPYTRREKDSRSYYVYALTIGFHIASIWRHFIMVSTDTQVALRSGKTLEPKEVVVEDEPIEKEESQPTVEFPTPE
ncbi:hypothetical protein EPI10_023973 [Gossypium australe]|uniref:Uncharacterized protein n=1 Tax=Gossypium australe TaxID=47621 RepID=A0A5B6VVQ2_9ROSI|nr:hypothetical protein EPI10_023973 [Gossypium australe]